VCTKTQEAAEHLCRCPRGGWGGGERERASESVREREREVTHRCRRPGRAAYRPRTRPRTSLHRRTCTSLAHACARPSNRPRIWTHLGSCGRDTRPDTCFSATSTHSLTNPPRSAHAGAHSPTRPAARMRARGARAPRRPRKTFCTRGAHPHRRSARRRSRPLGKAAQPAGLCPGDRRHTVVEHSRPAARPEI